MTVNELLSAAAALFFETDTSAYHEVALPFVNMLLAECFEANNRILRKAGRQELTPCAGFDRADRHHPL